MPLKLIPPRAGKSPFWYVRGTYLRQYVDRSTKALDRATAAKFLTAWKSEIEQGSFTKPGEPTFLDAAVEYMAATGDDRFLEPLTERLGAKYLKDIDQAEIDRTALSLYPQGTPATRNRQVYTPVSAILKHAGFAWKMRRPKGWRGKERTEWLWPEQAFAVIDAAYELDAEFGAFCLTLNYTGMRLSECTTGFLIADLRLQEAFASVKETKNGFPRPVHLPPIVVAALASHPRGLDRFKPGETVFRFRKRGWLYDLLSKAFERAGVAQPDGVGFHIFRHTWGTWMRRYAGLDVDGLVDTQVWRDRASAKRYAHVVASEEAKKADLLPVPMRANGR